MTTSQTTSTPNNEQITQALAALSECKFHPESAALMVYSPGINYNNLVALEQAGYVSSEFLGSACYGATVWYLTTKGLQYIEQQQAGK